MNGFRISRPKTLAERLSWMAENLPGFKEELDAVNAMEIATEQKSASIKFHQRRNQGDMGFPDGGAN